MTPAPSRVWAALLLALVLAGADPLDAQPVSLESYLTLHRRLAESSDEADRARLGRLVAELRGALLRSAAESSRVFVALERRPDAESAGEVGMARLVALDETVTVEAMGGARAQTPEWERAGELPLDVYLALMARLLDDSTVSAGFPPQSFDPNASGPRRAAMLRLAIGDEEWALSALYGAPYERLSAIAAAVVELCRAIPLKP
jgi:hypothetical protein